MTPLAQRIARELTLPVRKRTFDDRAGILSLFSQDMHCFEVSAVAQAVNAAMDNPVQAGDGDAAWNIWRDIESMASRIFLPSPVTWLEQIFGNGRIALVLHEAGGYFRLCLVQETRYGIANYSLGLCDFRTRGLLEIGDRIEIVRINETATLAFEEFKKESSGTDLLDVARHARISGDVSAVRAVCGMLKIHKGALDHEAEVLDSKVSILPTLNRFIGGSILMLDLINTPGIIGMKQHDLHRGLAKQLSRIGSYPLRGWTEIVLKTNTVHARGEPSLTGPAFHKCLHFVRSHERRYQSGHIALIPAHWRGDPALGIKRTRYRVEPASQVA